MGLGSWIVVVLNSTDDLISIFFIAFTVATNLATELDYKRQERKSAMEIELTHQIIDYAHKIIVEIEMSILSEAIQSI